MNTTPLHRTRAAVCTLALSLCTAAAFAQTAQRRIPADIASTSRVTLAGSRSPRAVGAADLGAVPTNKPIQGITMVFSLTAAQKSDLQSLIASQQDPTSPLYRQWITPAAFAARFGMSDADLASAESWIEQQGFSIDSVAPNRTRISFSGTAAQVAAAFGAPLHYYTDPSDASTQFAPSADITLPSGLAGSVAGISHLSSFRIKPHLIKKAPQAVTPNFTSSQTGNNFLSPGDIATIYDITPAYNSGYTGTGQTIAVIGQSAIVTTDITNFQTAAGVPVRAPNVTLMPGTGTSTLYTSDESESDLDIEWSSSIAKGATIDFIYTGSNPTFGVFDALTYAIDNDIAPIITISYGSCEPLISMATFQSTETALAQAATQGQTVVTSSGDEGSSTCSGQSNSVSIEEELAVDYPASSSYVTGMGGTEFPAADVATGNTTYWQAEGSTDIVSSAKSYIPEQVWNDDSTSSGLSAGGGGVSTQIPRPTWQTGVSGLATGFYRLVPDISMTASPNNAGFLYCSSDTSVDVTGSCSHGFRDVNNTNLTIAGGTSFDAPIFAGMVAIINQARGFTASGVVNPILYTLASNSTTYASAFHDITSGSNACLAGTAYCGASTSVIEYYATTGYDEASGLGSVDFNNLLTAWPTSTSGTGRGSFTLAATAATVASGSSGTSTVTITPVSGYTGTIAWSISASLANACYTIPNTTVTGATATPATLTINASSANCTAAAKLEGIGARHNASSTQLAQQKPAPKPFHQLPAELATAGLLFAGLFSRRSRKLRGILAILVVSLAGIALTGCSNSVSTSGGGTTTPVITLTTVNATPGTYTVTVTGTDTLSSKIAASTQFTLTIH